MGSLGNSSKKPKFATAEQVEYLDKMDDYFPIQLACHELLGHGVGKLNYRGDDGKCPSWTDPITNESFESCYEKDETWTTKFGSMATSYEECRADTCALYL